MFRSGWSCRHWRVGLGIALLGVSVAAPGAAAQERTSAVQALLEILRDRSVITVEEYGRLRQELEPAPPAAPLAAPSPPPAPEPVARAVEAALEGKWYERIRLRGYTQFRYTDVLSHSGASVEVPADRSVNEAETFVIRRGRMIFSGDATDRLYIYAQSDFNGSTGSGDYSLQMRDLYGDVALNASKTWRVRLGQSKVPFGFVNLQSSQNRLAVERPDALNSAVEGERDYGAYLMWAPTSARQRFSELVSKGLKGSGDYGVVAVGAFSGQGLNRSDLNGEPHLVGRLSYPFLLRTGQIVELGVQGYHGRFVTPTQAISRPGGAVTPQLPSAGVTDQRVAVSFIWYPQPIGIESEWTFGRGPTLSGDSLRVEAASLHGGYVQTAFRRTGRGVTLPFARWQYYDGGRKFARNAPRSLVNELDLGVEFAPWPEVELTALYTRTLRRTRTSAAPYEAATNGNRVGVQLQWNY